MVTGPVPPNPLGKPASANALESLTLDVDGKASVAVISLRPRAGMWPMRGINDTGGAPLDRDVVAEEGVLARAEVPVKLPADGALEAATFELENGDSVTATAGHSKRTGRGHTFTSSNVSVLPACTLGRVRWPKSRRSDAPAPVSKDEWDALSSADGLRLASIAAVLLPPLRSLT